MIGLHRQQGRRSHAATDGFQQDRSRCAGAAREGHAENFPGSVLPGERVATVDNFAGKLIIPAPKTERLTRD